MMRRKGEKQFV
jgi:hypothetical protein